MRIAALMVLLAGARGAAPSISLLSRRCGLLAISRSLDDPMARCIAGDTCMGALCTEVASVWTRRGLEEAMSLRESAGLRALWLRKAAEDAGGDQMVLLPAGLDTAGHDGRCASGMNVWEVEAPQTSAMKRHLVDTRGAQVRRVAASITYVPESVTGHTWQWGLMQNGFDVSRRTTWLIPDLALEDLHEEAVSRILRAPIVYSPAGSTLIACVRRPADSLVSRLSSMGFTRVKEVATNVRGELGVIAVV